MGKAARPTIKASTTEAQLSAISEWNSKELKAQWRQLGESAPPSVPDWLLRALLAAKRQEQRHGALPASVRRELARLAQADGSQGSRRAGPQLLTPGTRLVREWNGSTILVEMTEHGLRYDDRTWTSLSQIARHITGAKWSGPRFFGLTKNGR